MAQATFSHPMGESRASATRRRAARLVAAVLTVLGITVVAWPSTSPSAAVAGETDGAAGAVRWLANQLDQGTYRNPLAAGPDHGLMGDAVFAMAAAGRPDLAEPILEVFENRGGVVDYVSYRSFLEGGEADRVGGSVAKMLVVALAAGRDVHDFGGLDLVAETRAAIIPDGPERGRLRDHGPHVALNTTNLFGQTLAVLGLVAVGAPYHDALEVLLDQQCSPGYFRIFFTTNPDGSPATCDQAAPRGASPPDGDATGFALQAMVAARAAGTPGLDGRIDATVTWLVDGQDVHGGWGGGVSTSAPNTNSTGLIVQALTAAQGPPRVIARGEAYLRSAQVGPGDAGSPLGGHIGAVAYTPEDYRSARATGIRSPDPWIRATAQAALGLSGVGFPALLDGEPIVPPTTTPSPSTPTTAPSGGPSTAPPSSHGPSAPRPGHGDGPDRSAPAGADRPGRWPGVPTDLAARFATQPADPAGAGSPASTGGDDHPDARDASGLDPADTSTGSGERGESARGAPGPTDEVSGDGDRARGSPPAGPGGSGGGSSNGPAPWVWLGGGLAAIGAAVAGSRLGAKPGRGS